MASLDVSVLQQELHDLRARQREVSTHDIITVHWCIGSTLSGSTLCFTEIDRLSLLSSWLREGESERSRTGVVGPLPMRRGGSRPPVDPRPSALEMQAVLSPTMHRFEPTLGHWRPFPVAKRPKWYVPFDDIA